MRTSAFEGTLYVYTDTHIYTCKHICTQHLAPNIYSPTEYCLFVTSEENWRLIAMQFLFILPITLQGRPVIHITVGAFEKAKLYVWSETHSSPDSRDSPGSCFLLPTDHSLSVSFTGSSLFSWALHLALRMHLPSLDLFHLVAIRPSMAPHPAQWL